MSASTEINPLRLASETTQALSLLVVAATICSSSITWFVAAEMRGLLERSIPPWDWKNFLVGPLALVVISLPVYILQPVLIGRRNGGSMRVDRNNPIAMRIIELSAVVGISSPLVFLERRGTSLQAQVLTLFRQRIQLGAGMMVLYLRQPETFDAIILHELGHIKHRDVRKGYLARSIVSGYILLAGVDAVYTSGWFIYTALARGWCPGLSAGQCLMMDTYKLLANLLMVVPSVLVVSFAYSTVVRMREFYADQISVLHGGKTQLIAIFHANLDPEMSMSKRLVRFHPSVRSRLIAIQDPLQVFSDIKAILFLAGTLVGVCLNFSYKLGFVRIAIDDVIKAVEVVVDSNGVPTASVVSYSIYLFFSLSLILASFCVSAAGIKSGLILGATKSWRRQLLNLAKGYTWFVTGMTIVGPIVVSLGEWLGGMVAFEALWGDVISSMEFSSVGALLILLLSFLPAMLIANVFTGRCRPNFSILYCFYFAWYFSNVLVGVSVFGNSLFVFWQNIAIYAFFPGAVAVIVDIVIEWWSSRSKSYLLLPPHWLVRYRP